jgi:lysophospholipase
MDHRGQGNSGRMTADSEVQYVVDFQDYVTDFKTLHDTVISPNNHSKKYLFAHSMGGGVASGKKI